MRIWKSFADTDGACYGISGFEAIFTGFDSAVGYQPITIMYGEQRLQNDYEVLDFSSSKEITNFHLK